LIAAISIASCGGDSDDGGAPASGGTGNDAGGAGTGGSSSGTGGSSSSTGGSGGSGGSISGAIPLGALPVELGTVSCAKVYECCTTEEIAQNPFYGETEQECALTMAAFLSLAVGPIQTSIDAGRVQYDGDALAQCLSRYRALTCADLMAGGADTADSLAGCERFLVPRVPLAGACTQDFECIEGYCDDTTETCAALLGPNAECSDDEECVSEYCDLSTSTCQEAPVQPSEFCGG
jgi:hypothetical protein